MRIVGVRPALAMLSGPTAKVALLEGSLGLQGIMHGVLSTLG